MGLLPNFCSIGIFFLFFSVMHFILLFILSIFSITISTHPQAEHDGQPSSTNQIDYSNLEPSPADDMVNKNGNTMNSSPAFDPTVDPADPNPPLSTDETANENDQTAELASNDVAGPKNPACDPNLATRDELDYSLLGYFPCLT